MAAVLYRLGGWSFRRRRTVLACWVGLIVLVALAGVTLKGTTDSSFTVPGTQSQDALNLLDRSFPGTGGATARIVFAAPPGQKLTDARYRGLLVPTLRLAARVPQSVTTQAAFKSTLHLSRNGRIAYGDLHFTQPVDKLTPATRNALQRVAEPLRRAGAQVAFSGGVITTGGKSGAGDLLGLVVALVVLLIVFGAVAVALLPLVIAFCGVGLGLFGLSALSGAVSLSSSAPTLASMLGLAVGIDYTLFIVSRHRAQVADGIPVEESAARAVATSGSAVCFAGSTVTIALCCLIVTGIPFLIVMGLAAAGTVIIAVLLALTLVPALLGFIGERAAKGHRLSAGRLTMGERWAGLVTARPLVTIAGVIVLLAIVAIPVLSLRLGLPDDGTQPPKTTQRVAYDLLSSGFGPGFNGPLTIVVDTAHDASAARAGVAARVETALAGVPDVNSVSPPQANQSNTISIINVTPDSGPTSVATEHLVSRIRRLAAPVQHQSGVQILVTGMTAINIDTSSKLSAALPSFLILIVGFAFILLVMVFRSVVVPIKAIVGFLLTIAASLGGVVFVFQDGHFASAVGVSGTGPVLNFLPILMVAILFGLAMDYEVFLVTRIREAHLRGEASRHAIAGGFRASARVVTAAAIIMTSVFGGFVATSDPITKSIGFGLALGVLIDAFVVRMTFVPAVLALLGERAWHLPGWLSGVVPNVDIEGRGLASHVDSPARAPSQSAPAAASTNA